MPLPSSLHTPTFPLPDKSEKFRDSNLLRIHHALKEERVEEVFNLHPEDLKLHRDTAYTLHAGKLNPVALVGTGSTYHDPASDSLVIMGNRQGGRLRAVSASGEAYGDPMASLGMPITQFKQRQEGPPAVNSDLYVLGYVSSSGTAYGFVPDRQVEFFVYK